MNIRNDFENLFETLNNRLPQEDGCVRPQTLGKLVSDDPRHFIFRRQKHRKKSISCKTLNCRLPPEDDSVWPQTLGKRVSDDLQPFIFRRRKKNMVKHFDKNFRRKKIRPNIRKTAHLGDATDFWTG